MQLGNFLYKLGYLSGKEGAINSLVRKTDITGTKSENTGLMFTL